jgi:acetone carboxylase gamma subunit
MTEHVVTEYLKIAVESERRKCTRCNRDLGSARDNYKRGCLVADRDPTQIHPARVGGEYTFAPDPAWCRVLEFYCPGCLALVEVEYLPPGHPITHDIEIDVDALKERFATQPAAAASHGEEEK